VLLSTILAGCASAPLRPSSVKGKGELWVQVIDQETSLPLREATVTLSEEYKAIDTDSNGIAILTGIDSGSYSFSISRGWFKTIIEPECEIIPDVVTERVFKMVSNDRLGE
jgi:hypothetical protein